MEITEKDLLEKHPYNILRSIDVSHLVRGKGGHKYLSWADAVDTLFKYYPDSQFRSLSFPKKEVVDDRTVSGVPYLKTEAGVFVEVEVTVKNEKFNVTRSEVFPVLDFRNKPIMNPNVFELNKSLKRALAKCIANHGLGLYIFQGEDLPLSEAEGIVQAREELKALLNKHGKLDQNAEKAINKMGVDILMEKLDEYRGKE